ncbi:MAG: F0F1 ATP synthase subunit epsilon [Bacillota bacterium]|nr:F0F1 ATP synthase subunit epsilon [Bacillota bacterium]
MASTYMLEIVTPDRKFFSDEVEMAIVRTSTGDIGILKNHELTVAPLRIGSIKVKIASEMKCAACSTGFISVEEDIVTIITDSAEWGDEIDVNRANEALNRAEKRLKDKKYDIDVERAKISMTRAINRVGIAEKANDHKNL